MDMDTSQNWLGFSLSNPSYLLQTQHGGEEAGPKLEDFLGGCSDHQQPLRYSDPGTGDVIYVDSELKSIAAGFLRSTPAVEQEVEVEKAMVPMAAESRKTVDTFGQRTSIYRGVTRHRWTGRYEAHLWDNSCRREGQSRKGRQVYLGGYDKEEKAARAYDLAALKYWGPKTTTNFPVANYGKELEEMTNMTRQEFVASLRRKSSGFSRGASIYRGVTRHHQHGRWQARIGRVAGNKDLYLGTFSTQEEAAEAYDIAAIKFRGLNAVTNFDMNRYDVKSIANSSLPIGGMAGRSKAAENSATSLSSSEFLSVDLTSEHQMDGFSVIPFRPDQEYWSLLALQQHQHQHQQQQQQPQSNQSPLGFGLFSSGVNMDFSNGSVCNGHNVMVSAGQGLVWSNGVLQQQEQSESHSNCSASSSIPYATPINGFGSVGYEGQSSNYVGSWNPQPSSSHYDYQSAKPNVAFFQTPIFGME